MSETRSTRGTYHHGDLRNALVRAAIDLLEEEGLAGLSLRAAARRAGVSQAAPYSHFKDKRALLSAVAAVGYRELGESMRAEAASAATPGDRMRAHGVGYVSFAMRRPALFRLMFGAEIAGARDEAVVRDGADAYRVIEDSTRETLASRGDTSADTALSTLGAWSLVHGLAMLLVDGKITVEQTDARDVRELARRVTELFVVNAPR